MKYATAEEFTKEFEKYKDLELPKVFKSQIEKVNQIVEHWKVCPACELGFNISEYDISFEKLFIKLAAGHIEYHICDGTYSVLWSKGQGVEKTPVPLGRG